MLKRMPPKPSPNSVSSFSKSVSELPSCTVMLFGNVSTVNFGSENILLGSKQPPVHSGDFSLNVPTKRKVLGHDISVINILGLEEAETFVEQVLWKLVNDKGIHAFIFVLSSDSYTHNDVKTLKWLQRTFSEHVLQFVMTLFTHEKQENCETMNLNEIPAMEHLPNLGRDRSHICNKNMNIQSEILELLEKIDGMMTENRQTGYTAEMYFQHNQRECAQTKTLAVARSGNANTNATHYNLILMGENGAGKSSAGNTMLGRDSFSVNATQQPASHDIHKEMVTISGAHFNVYDVLGLYEEGMNNEELLKKMQGLEPLDESLPTVILLVLNPEVSNKERSDQTENIKLFNLSKSGYKKTAEFIKALPKWLRQNTWLLFTRGDELERERITVEEIINQNEELKRTVEKLHNRYHVFNNKSSKSSDQVIQLVKKIQEAPLQMSPKIKLFPRTLCPVSERYCNKRIVLLGKSGAGKSATANTILGEKRFKSELSPASVTTASEMGQGFVEDRNVLIVDTPGLFDTSMSAEDLGVEIGRSVYLSSPGPHAFLYVLQINLRFTEQEEDVVHKFEMMFGEEMRKYTIVLFTQGDQLEGKSADTLIKKNSSLNKLVEQCGGGYHVFNNKDLSNREQVTQLVEKIDRMVEKNGGSCYCNQMFEDADRFKKEAEENRRRSIAGDHKKREKVQKQNEIKSNVRKETVMKTGKHLLDEAARFMEKTRKYIQKQSQEETEIEKKQTEVRGLKETVRFRQELMNESNEKTERHEPGVKVQKQIFEQLMKNKKEGMSRQNEADWKKQQEQRQEKIENINEDEEVKVKRRTFEKSPRGTNEEEGKNCGEELIVEDKEICADTEKSVKAKMQIFEKSMIFRQEEKKQWKKEKETKTREEKKQEVENTKKGTGVRGKLQMFVEPRCSQEEELQHNDGKRKQSEEKDENVNEGDKKEEAEETHKKDTDVKLKRLMFEEAATPSQDRTKNSWMQEEKRKHTEKGKADGCENSVKKRGVKAKLLMFEKESWTQGQEKQRQMEGENRKQREESQQKEKRLNKETDVMVKMQMFDEESLKQEEASINNEEVEKQWGEQRKSPNKDTNVKGMTIQKSISCKTDKERGKHKENDQQECSGHNDTPSWHVKMDRHSKDRQENKDQKTQTEQHEQEQSQAEDGEDEGRKKNKRRVEREYKTIHKIYQNVEEITIEESTTHTQTTEDDPGLETFLQQHSNHLSAAGQVSVSFRQDVAAGASAGCAAGASIGATVGLVLGPVGIAVGSAIGGFIGGVGGAVGGVFRAILRTGH